MKARKCVKFANKESSLFYIPCQDRKGKWMMMALDRCGFKTRMDKVSQLIEPILKRRLENLHNENSIQCSIGGILLLGITYSCQH